VLSAFGGGRFLGARYGAPPARIVALHGWARTHADFDGVLAGMDAVAPDLPGFGATAPPAEAWGSSDYADAIAPVLADEDPPVVLVGHSFGGRVAVMLAAARPDLVRALVLSGVPLCRPPGMVAPRPSRRLRAAKALHRLGLVGDAGLEARRRRSGSPDYRNATGVLRDVFVRVVHETDDGTYLRALADVRGPVELVWGERDTAAPPSIAELARTDVAGARLTIVPGVGHLTPTEAPEALRQAIARARVT
jgi:pimeloyl-ACP methyl ester carboxylesterase